MSVSACLSFEADHATAFDAAGEGAWRRFTEITALARATPRSVAIEVHLRWDEPLRLDHDGKAIADAQQRWNERTSRLAGELLRSHSDWAGTLLSMRVGEPQSYAGRRCGARVSALFPLSEMPRLCPDAATDSCMVTCDHIACERR